MLRSPNLVGGDYGAYLNMAAIASLLQRDRSPGAVDDAQRRMWELALHLEEGQTERTARALEEARQAAREAMDTATQRPTDENRAELERKLQELEQAIQRHLQALAEQARREQAEIPFDPNAEHLSERDFQRKAEEAREAAREGRMEDAQQRMAELERMLQQLRNARVARGDQRNNERRQRGQQQMGALQDMVGREGKLMDHAQSRDGQSTPESPFRRSRPSANPGDQQAQRQGDQKVQQALRRALGELMQQFGDLTGQVPQGLGEADQAMREAGQALAQGRDAAAGAAQQRAIEALQKGGREMAQQMAKQFGRGQQGEGDDGDEMGGLTGFGLQNSPGDQDGAGQQGTLPGQRRRQRDPLGRDLGQGASGGLESEGVHVPAEMERQRSQAIQEELRRRGGERTRPQEELDYIDRLLKQF
jgi:hypothetical protein